MIKTVIFDMDGLMFDTERLNNEAWIAAAQKMGKTIQKEMLDSMKGVNRVECDKIMRSWLGEDLNLDYMRTLKQKYTEQYLKDNGVPVKKGLRELLSYLKTHRYTVVLSTSTSENEALRLLKMADVEKYFDHLVFGNMVEKSKPEPDIFLEAVRRAYTKPENCLVLEDSPNGVRAAHAAGCHVVMVPDMVPATEELRTMTDDVVESLEDVEEMMKAMNMIAV
ncbi:MAG: HAD family phosphatase [Lachnospiraceae bacterium]|nr:HAD family phosphatase [Lachnospiraceae bacterium]